MATWTAKARAAGAPDEVLALLTEPGAIARWAPVDFEVLDFEGERLEPGDRVRVRGALVGRPVSFDVDVEQADDGRLALTAHGPIRLDVEYRALQLDCGSEIHASVSVSGQGLFGRLMAQAAEALLAGGALRLAVSRIARELEPALAV